MTAYALRITHYVLRIAYDTYHPHGLHIILDIGLQLPIIKRSDNLAAMSKHITPVSRVDSALAALIKRGRPGDRLPAEPALAAQLGISRAKLREVLRSFEERGVVIRRHGAGTFIAPRRPVIENGLEVLESVERLARRSGLKTHMDAAIAQERPASARELEKLGLKSATMVLSVTRVITTDSQPVAYLVDVVPLEYLGKDDLDEKFNGSVLDVFLRRGSPPLSYARTDLSAEAADAALARQLHIRRGSPLFKMEAQLYSQENRIIDYSIGYFVPGYLHFHIIRHVGVETVS